MLCDKWGRTIVLPTVSPCERSERVFAARTALDNARKSDDKDATKRAFERFMSATRLLVR